ncbi:ATP-dependent DNA helicase PIF1-like protein [Tanacetum coccineum]
MIVLAVASLGIAFFLLPACRTVHSRFVIPLDLMENSTCDTTLRDILGSNCLRKRSQLFGGMTVLLGGDFKQILLVIPKAKRPEIVQACINRSELWKYCKVLVVGYDNLPAKIKEWEDEPTWIEILERFLIKEWDTPIEQIVAETYPDFTLRQTDEEYLQERTILTLRNEDADAIN